MPLLLILDTLIVHAKNLNKFPLQPLCMLHIRSVAPHRERGIEVARVSETTFNYVKQAGRQEAGSNTSQWHHQKRISVIRAEAGRARHLGPGNGNGNRG